MDENLICNIVRMMKKKNKNLCRKEEEELKKEKRGRRYENYQLPYIEICIMIYFIIYV